MVTAANGAPFTWNSAAFTWQDTNAGKTWLTASASVYTLAPTESVTLLPTEIRAPHIAPTESAQLSSRSTRRTECALHTALTAAETLAKQTAYDRIVRIALACTAADARHTRRTDQDALSLTSFAARAVQLGHCPHLAITSATTPRTVYRRPIGETVTARETSARHSARTEQRTCTLADTYLTPWQGILSNITLMDGGLTDDAWKRTSASPSGYEAFHPFEVGEYTYRDALIRLLLTTGAAGTDPLLYDVSFHVDIEDTRESGIAECSADAPTRITLTRHYYHPPRIVLTVLGSAETDLLIPRLAAQSTTESGKHTFDCELLRTDGTRADGTVSWMAEGY